MTEIYIVFALLAFGFVFGKINERNHYRSIVQREQMYAQLPTTSSKYVLGSEDHISNSKLVSANVVISVDYFKRLLAGLRNIFGGAIQPYETLVDRARREAVLRLKESCPQANEIINLRIETSSISKGNSSKIGSVEVLAYATAIYRDS